MKERLAELDQAIDEFSHQPQLQECFAWQRRLLSEVMGWYTEELVMARAPHQQTAEKRLEKVFRTAESIKEECRLLQRNENGHWSQRGIDLFEGEILASCKILQLRDEFAEVDKGFDVV